MGMITAKFPQIAHVVVFPIGREDPPELCFLVGFKRSCYGTLFRCWCAKLQVKHLAVC